MSVMEFDLPPSPYAIEREDYAMGDAPQMPAMPQAGYAHEGVNVGDHAQIKTQLQQRHPTLFPANHQGWDYLAHHINQAATLANTPYHANVQPQMNAYLQQLHQQEKHVPQHHLHAIADALGADTRQATTRRDAVMGIGRAMVQRSRQKFTEDAPEGWSHVSGPVNGTSMWRDEDGGTHPFENYMRPHDFADDMDGEFDNFSEPNTSLRENEHVKPKLAKHWGGADIKHIHGLAGKIGEGDEIDVSADHYEDGSGAINIMKDKKDGTQFSAVAYKEDDGVKTLHVHGFNEGSNKTRGHNISPDDLQTFVQSIGELGIQRVNTEGAGRGAKDKRGKRAIGSSIWPKLGFEAPIDPTQNPFGAKSLQELYQTREGVKWWEQNGHSTQMSLDLRDPNSLGAKRFQSWAKKLEGRRKK